MRISFSRGFRIAALVILMTVMLGGLVSPFSCDALYERLSDMNNSAPEVNALTSRGLHDCTVESLDVTQQILGSLERRSDVLWLSRMNVSLTDINGFASVDRLRQFILVFFLAGLSCYSLLHISFIHLKDGHK